MEKVVKVQLKLIENVLSRLVPVQEEGNDLISGLDREVSRSFRQYLPDYDLIVEQELVQDEQKRHPIYATMKFRNLDECRGDEAQLGRTAVTEAVNRVVMAMINNRIREGRKVPGMIYGNGFTRDVYIDGKKLNPKPSLKLRNHSPDGFNWGYGGSGPSQLALAILLKFMKKDEAACMYHEFKWDKISGLTIEEDFMLPIEAVETWIAENRDNLAA